jgi:single-strand DNA-binding protein
MNLNRIVLIGKALNKPTAKVGSDGTSVANVTLQVERFTRQDGTTEVDQIPVVAWQNQADDLMRNCNPNDLMLIEGRIQVRTVQEPNGQTNWITEVVAGMVRKVTGEAGAALQGFTAMPSAAGFSTAIASQQQEPEPALDDVPF